MPFPGMTVKSLTHHKALIPLFASIIGGSIFAGAYLARLCLTNPDCSWDRKNNPHPWQKMKPTDQYKFMCVSGDYSKMTFPPERPDI
jgi:NADH dehydrogenase (ubiquinone) 1 alpha subcomplex subunit 4